MLVALTSSSARDVATGEQWGTEPCSSKDSASRMNSPRNSKSSGTPHISPEPKGNICFGAEVDMEEDDGSSHSGQNEEGHVLHSEPSPGGPGHREAYHKQLKGSADSTFQADRATREAVCDEGDSDSERQSNHLQPDYCHSELNMVQGRETEARSGQSVPAASKPRGSPLREALPGKSGASKRQKTSHRTSPADLAGDLCVEEESLQRLQAGSSELCQPASEAPKGLKRSSEVLKETLPEETAIADGVAESLSRACSIGPGTDRCEEDADAEEPPVSKKQRSSKHKRAASGVLPGKRGNRASGNGHVSEGRHNGSQDEDYLPPGEIGDHDHVPVKRARLQKATRAMCKSDSLPSVAPSTILRQPARLRWSASVGPASPPVASPSACRRLRSQPVDLTDLRPNAFAFCAPTKRPRHPALHQGLASLQQLSDAQPTPLVRSRASGIIKPKPQWGGQQLDEQVLQPVMASLQQNKARRDSDCKAMDGVQPSTQCDPAALAERLGQSRLGKAARVLEPVKAPTSPAADDILPSCKQLFPVFMAASLASWESKLDSTFVSLFGEPAPCTMARQQRDAHHAWDDLLARHALESESIENFEDLLLLK